MRVTVIRPTDPRGAGRHSAACPVASTSAYEGEGWEIMRFLQYLALLVLGVVVAFITELASDNSETSRVLSSIKPAVWTIVSLLSLAATISIACELKGRKEEDSGK